MKCQACGTEVVETGVFCHKCGARLAGADPGPAPDDQPVSDPGAGAPDEPPPQPSARDQFHDMAAVRRSSAAEPERDLWVGSYSPRDMYGTWAVYGLITVVGIGVWLYFWGFTRWGIPFGAALLLWLYGLGGLLYQRMSVRYRLTTRRFFHERGILRRVTDRIEIIDMDDITVEQTIVDRLAGVGTIKITSSDRTHPVLVLRGIEKVQQVASIMDETRLDERRRRGLHIESV